MDNKIKERINELMYSLTASLAVGAALVITNLYRIAVIATLVFLYKQNQRIESSLVTLDSSVENTRSELIAQDSLLSKQVDSLFQMHPWKSPRK